MKHANDKASYQEHGGLWRARGCLLRGALCAVSWLLFGVSIVHGQEKPTDYQVEATYLYNFGRFVEWPAGSAAAGNSSFNICVLGQDPFGPALDTILVGETIAGKSVVAKRISTPQEGVDCRVLFISSSESGQLQRILTTLADASVLMVSDLPRFAQRGGMVQFVLVGDRVRFQVNRATAEHAGLTLSSELLKVAMK